MQEPREPPSPAPVCRTCGGPLQQGASPDGHCPTCLLRTTLLSGADDEPIVQTEPWVRIGGLELLEELGRGGMGVVYRAYQPSLGRSVAVKLLLGARFASAEERHRFQREAQAAASLRHPGIVAILDFGEADGTPWFSMEYLPGRSLAQRVSESALSPRASAECVVKLCAAVDHAHAHGVLHRDLKPANILLDAADEPRVTDFGIACRFVAGNTAAHGLTRTGQTLGSPGYAAPELALEGRADERTDVYGLGAILYHLLTARAPFDGPTLEAVLLQLRETDPVPARRFNPRLPRDLETICLKCLAKVPQHRYASAREVAAELERFLNDLPIQARPPGPLARSAKWARRNPSTAALLACLFVALTAAVAGSVAFARREARIEHRASLVSEASALIRNGHAGSRTEALEKLLEAWKLRPSTEVRSLAASCLTLPEIAPAKFAGPMPGILETGASGDGRRLSVVQGDAILVQNVSDGTIAGTIRGAETDAPFALDDNGQRLALVRNGRTSVDLISVADDSVVARLQHPLPVVGIVWSGELIATACENRFIYVWEATGALRHRLSGHDSPYIQLAFRPGGQELASTAADSHVRIWHAARGVELLHLEHVHDVHSHLQWSRDGKWLHGLGATGKTDSFAVELGSFLQVLSPSQPEPHSENFGSADLSADGRFAVVIDEVVARVWDFERGRVVDHLQKSAGQWLSARFAPGGDELLTCGWAEPLSSRSLFGATDGNVILSRAKVLFEGHGNLLRAVSARGGHVVLSNNSLGTFTVVPIKGGAAVSVSHPNTLAATICPDGTWLATSSYSHPGLRVWSLPAGNQIATLCPDEIVMQLLAVGDDRLLVKTAEHLRVIDTKSWSETSPPMHHPRLRGLAVTRDGRLLAAATDSDIRILDTATWTEQLRLRAPEHAGWLGECDLVFDADASHLIAHTSLGSVIRWNLAGIESELQQLGFGASQLTSADPLGSSVHPGRDASQ